MNCAYRIYHPHVISWLTALLWLLAMPLQGQEIRLTLSRSIFLNQVSVRPVNNVKIGFVNIGSDKAYKSNKLKRKIDRLEQRRDKDYYLMDSLYTLYVSHFSPTNFKPDEDLYMVWRLGQIKEILNDTTMALFYYGLALKNHSRFYNQVKLHYDILRSNKFNEYVELDYYYRIVQARLKVDTLIPPKSVHTRVSSNINTDFPEYGPSLDPTGMMMFFTSRRTEKRPVTGLDYEQNEDLFFAHRDLNNYSWSTVKKLPPIINSGYNEGSASVSKDGKQLFFSRCNAPDGFGICDIYSADISIDPENGSVSATNVQNLGPNVNSISWDSHPCISADGQALFFASNRDGGFGRTDIYVTKLQPDGRWGKAENLGPIINTLVDEVSPYLHTATQTLYFSSKGQILNFGGFDIFKSRWFDGWEEPRSVGPLVNTERDEYYFAIDQRGDTLFYAKDTLTDPQDFDLYSFSMPMAARADADIALNGYLIDSVTKKPLTGIVVAVDLDSGTEVEPIYINKFGYFEFKLVNNRHYQLYILGEDAIRITKKDLFVNDSINELLKFSMKKAKPIIIESFQFSANEAELNRAQEAQLDFLIDFLMADKGRRLLVTGHTDADGDPDFNLRLSQDRADAIKNYIMARTNLEDTSITAIGAGSTRPIFPNDTEENKARNRRVEFEILPSEKDIDRMRKSALDYEDIGDVDEIEDESDEYMAEPNEEEKRRRKLESEGKGESRPSSHVDEEEEIPHPLDEDEHP
jgi:outer membrane protein OmpA-like peptidoglycan-associated protein